MSKIFKYPLSLKGTQTIVLPRSATILHVALQDNQPHIWAMHNDEQDEQLEERTIDIYGTGEKIPDEIDQSYIGTIQYPGLVVFHIFGRMQEYEID